jgi:hypothetical protein
VINSIENVIKKLMITLKSLIKKIHKEQDLEGYSDAAKYPMDNILRG